MGVFDNNVNQKGILKDILEKDIVNLVIFIKVRCYIWEDYVKQIIVIM